MPIRQDQAHWRLDYGWARRGGWWDEFTDVLLVGDTGGEARSAEALRIWVAQQSSDHALVDGVRQEIFYAGGVRGYLDARGLGAVGSPAICLHSRGEDAFDSLSHGSREIARFLRSRGCERLRWIEARHDRTSHRLCWP